MRHKVKLLRRGAMRQAHQHTIDLREMIGDLTSQFPYLVFDRFRLRTVIYKQVVRGNEKTHRVLVAPIVPLCKLNMEKIIIRLVNIILILCTYAESST